MAIDWNAIARQVGDLNPDGSEKGSGTTSGQHALDLIIGEENLRGAVDYWVTQKPGAFTAEMVLKIIGSKVAMERCYEIYKTQPNTESAARALFLLAGIADSKALSWVDEFLNDSNENLRWNGLCVLQNILYGPVGDADIATATQLLDKADTDSDPRLRERAKQVRLQLAPYEPHV